MCVAAATTPASSICISTSICSRTSADNPVSTRTWWLQLGQLLFQPQLSLLQLQLSLLLLPTPAKPAPATTRSIAAPAPVKPAAADVEFAPWGLRRGQREKRRSLWLHPTFHVSKGNPVFVNLLAAVRLLSPPPWLKDGGPLPLAPDSPLLTGPEKLSWKIREEPQAAEKYSETEAGEMGPSSV